MENPEMPFKFNLGQLVTHVTNQEGFNTKKYVIIGRFCLEALDSPAYNWYMTKAYDMITQYMLEGELCDLKSVK